LFYVQRGYHKVRGGYTISLRNESSGIYWHPMVLICCFSLPAGTEVDHRFWPAETSLEAEAQNYMATEKNK